MRLFLAFVLIIVGLSSLAQSTKANRLFYFPFNLFPAAQLVDKYEDSSTVLIATTYEKAQNKTDTFKTYAKIIPNQFDTASVLWYSKHLLALQEPVLFDKDSGKEIYRFTWLRTFHNPIAIRIEKSSNDYHIFWKVCNGAGGYQPGTLVVDKKKIISKQDWDKFQNLLTGIDFWNIKNIQNIVGLDGSQWILEGKTISKYNVIDRWSPNEKGKYFQCCNFLIELTGLKIKGNAKY